MALLTLNQNGIYCEKADVYIDTWRPVARNLVTHAHADHARSGSKHYLCTHGTKPIMQYRLGLDDHAITSVDYGEKQVINGVEVSFHPAGHVIGSAQIRLSHKGETWVVSGDYKTEDDGISTPFEAVKCQHFVTECTFGLPIYRWQPQAEIIAELTAWWNQCQQQGKVALLSAYSLGKAQRILQNLPPDIGPVFTHGAVENINQVLRDAGHALPHTVKIPATPDKEALKGALVIAPPAALDTPWARKLGKTSKAIASGWMALRGARRSRAADRGFILSDHADWKGLNEAIAATEAENVYCTHGYSHIFAKWLREEKGLNAQVLETAFSGENDDDA